MLVIGAFVLFSALKGSVTAIPTDTGSLQHQAAPHYPATLNTTAPSAVEIRITSNNARLNNRNVQLRPTKDPNTPLLAVVDPWSPVLLLQLRSGVMFSERRNASNGLVDLGPVGYLRTVDGTEDRSSSLQELYFARQTPQHPPAANFQLINVSEDAEYNLYHNIHRDGVVNGFTACNRGEYFQLYYYLYTGPVPNFGPECEFVAAQVHHSHRAVVASANALQTTIAPSESFK